MSAEAVVNKYLRGAGWAKTEVTTSYNEILHQYTDQGRTWIAATNPVMNFGSRFASSDVPNDGLAVGSSADQEQPLGAPIPTGTG